MRTSLSILGLVLSGVANAAWNVTCTERVQRKAWHTLSDAEKREYLRAEKCLMTSPPRNNITGAATRWDEMQWGHIVQSNYIHGNGAFLPWHRYFMRTHEHLLQSECGYRGGVPWWDEQRDADAGPLSDASVWGADELSFGTTSDGCVADGPFANTTLRLSQQWGVNNYTHYCLERQYDAYYWDWANSSYVEPCAAIGDYVTARPCYSAKPHSSVHLGVGGTVKDQSASPGDPIFYLHHTNLDRLWWEWQAADLPARLTDMGGNLVTTTLDDGEWLYPSAAQLDYDGETGNVTTLHHVLWMAGLVPNVTIADVMDMSNDFNCAEYV
ncbi:amino acid transporter [Xylariaceae sp. FL0804]|nr:amino acid transporter [Xylariaceae sp. FL0804]